MQPCGLAHIITPDCRCWCCLFHVSYCNPRMLGYASTIPGALRRPHDNVKVASNLLKSDGFALLIMGVKSEIRISDDQNIQSTDTISTRFRLVLDSEFWSFVFVSACPGAT
jgi:hypothetical protein